ncbi:MAG: site-specific integrase [Desulfomonile tiedjei]|uniref:Site-specific integrase n=1 Tax=Desulfomonile tiedjei TaxID=2358 RepID=A0A9D6V229_9BACT|nr:site-specific integrase [Desulfomonile tiedjei]
MAVTKRKKGYYIYFRPFKQELVGVATDARSKTEARQIEMALLKACRTGDYEALDPTTREVCVRMYQNQSWALPDQLELTLPTSGELNLWKGIQQCLTYPGMKDSSNRERHEQAFLHVVRLMGKDRTIKSMWVPDIEDYQMRRLDEGAAPSTVNKEKAALSKMFNVLIKLRLIEVNPAKLVKNLNEKSGEREVYLSHKDFQRIVLQLPVWERPIVQTLYYTGMRRGEALGLTRDRVNLKERMILLRPEDVKERRWKRVPIHRDLVPILEEVLKVRSIGSDKIFLINGRASNEDSLRKPWVKAVKALEFDAEPRLHDLRHSWKTNSMRSGMDPEIRESIMGHWFRGKTVAERYGRISDADLVREIDKVTFQHGETEILVSESKKKNPKELEPPSGKMLTNC